MVWYLMGIHYCIISCINNNKHAPRLSYACTKNCWTDKERKIERMKHNCENAKMFMLS